MQATYFIGKGDFETALKFIGQVREKLQNLHSKLYHHHYHHNHTCQHHHHHHHHQQHHHYHHQHHQREREDMERSENGHSNSFIVWTPLDKIWLLPCFWLIAQSEKSILALLLDPNNNVAIYWYLVRSAFQTYVDPSRNIAVGDDSNDLSKAAKKSGKLNWVDKLSLKTCITNMNQTSQ